MKNKLSVISIILILLSLTLTSCLGGGQGEPPVDDGPTENLIFDAKSELYFIQGTGITSDRSSYIIALIEEKRDIGKLVQIDSVDSDPHEHEIVVGLTDRPITQTALGRLDRLERNTEDDFRYVIYSDGSSVAIVFDTDPEGLAEETAINKFLDILHSVDTEYVAERGVISQGTVNIIDYLSEKDAATRATYYNALAERIGGEEGQAFANAMLQFYELYSNDLVIWLANLYEPSICVCNGLYGELECSGTKYCGTGGFYYSNSARDTIGYLPDVESTYQALGLLNSSGLTKQYGESWFKLLDKEMKNDILAFVRAIQREDGYFVHPQWTSPGTSRISRDLNWSTSILKTMNAYPYYTTPTGMKGIGAPASTTAMSGQLRGSSAAACSSVILTAQSYLPQLENVETFKAYLISLNVKTNSYSAGNTLAAQSSQISARDKVLGLSKENSLYMTMINHLNECQNPENGTWDYKKPGDSDYDLYYQVNGLMKISGVYGTSYPLQYVDKAVETAMTAITYDKKISAAVDIYNPWFALTNIFKNLRGCGGDEGIAKVAELRQQLYASPELLLATRDKISICKKVDGSFSYSPKYSSATSQGCPAAVPNTVEGDVNGTVLSFSGLLDYTYSALGLSGATKIPVFGEVERYMFMKEIGSLKHYDKPNSTTVVEPEDFESYYPDDIPTDDSSYTTKLNSNGVIKVVEREDGAGNALLIDSQTHSSAGDYINVKNQSPNPSLNTFVFEGDFCLMSSNKAYPVQVIMGSAYMFTLRVVDSQVRIYESSSENSGKSVNRDLGVRIELGQWFRVKVEYFYGTHDEVRIKFYFDGDVYDSNDATLIAVTDNYQDKNGNKINNPTGTPSKSFDYTRIYVLSNAVASILVDNIASYRKSEGYVPVDSDDLVYNIDAPAKDKVVYGFDGGELPEEITLSGSGLGVDGTDDAYLSAKNLQKTSSITVPINDVKASGNCVSVSFDILCTSAANGDMIMSSTAGGQFGSAFGFALVGRADSAGSYVAVAEYNGSLKGDLKDARIPVGQSVTLTVNYFDDYRVSLVYINGEFIGVLSSLFTDGNRLLVSDVVLSFVGGKSYDVRLDNLVVERNGDSYVEAVKPDKDSVVHDFESPEASKPEGTNVKVTSFGANLVASLDSRSSAAEILIPVNNRSKISSVIFAELSLAYQTLVGESASHDIAVTDEDGNVIFGVTVCADADNVYLYEMNRYSEPQLLLASFKKDKLTSVGFELSVGQQTAYIYADGTCVSKTQNIPFPENIGLTAAYFTVSSVTGKAVLLVDDVTAETLYSAFESKKPTTLENGEKEGMLTFEKSNSNNLPTRLYKYLSAGASIRVENVLDKVTGRYSNAAILSTKKGINDKIGMQTVGGEDLSSYSCVTFETDFKIDIRDRDSHMFWFYLSKNVEADSDLIYQVSFSISSNKLYFFDRSAKSGYIEKKFYTDITVSELSSWHHLKIEYYAGDKDTARIRLFIDDELIYVSNNYVGRTNNDACPASRTGVKKAFFYSFANTDADLYVDNMNLYGSDATCTDTVGEK